MRLAAVGVVVGLVACGGAQVGTPTLPDAKVVGYAVASRSGAPLELAAGEALPLKIVAQLDDGTVRDLPPDAGVQWTSPATVVALSPEEGGDGAGALPAACDAPSAVFVQNPARPEHDQDLQGVLFALDPGSQPGAELQVSALVDGVGAVSASVQVDPAPVGDPSRGAQRYGPAGFGCAACHGATGHGPPSSARSAGVGAPGLNAEPGNLASDPAWSAALLGFAARADVDNAGVALRSPMPDFERLADRDGALMTAQDAADIYAFLQTQQQ